MEDFEIAERFLDFLTEVYRQELERVKFEGAPCLLFNFAELDRYDPELADKLLEEPERTLSIAEQALAEAEGMGVKLRIKNLPELRYLRIRELRSEHIGKLLGIEGIVKRASEVRPEVAEAVFLCPECNQRISVIQTERFIKPPLACSCGNRKGFKLVDQKLVDARWLYVEEPYEVLSGERPSELMIYLKSDLTTPRMQNNTDPGNRLKIVGILKQMARRVKKARSTQLEIYLEANWVEPVEVGWEEVEITQEEEERIKQLASDPQVYEKLVASFAPTMFGLEEVKEAILLQLFGGETHCLPDGTKIRGNIHVLLVGDPAAGKCVEGDTKVVLADGRIVEIRGVVEVSMRNAEAMEDGFYASINHHLPSLNPAGRMSVQKASIAWKRLAPPRMYEIETESGAKIAVTPSHPFLTIEGGQLIYKRADELRVGNFLATPKFLPVRSEGCKLQIQVTPELCKLIGYALIGFVSFEEDGVKLKCSAPGLLKDHRRLKKVLAKPAVLKKLKGLDFSGKIPEFMFVCSNEMVRHLLRAVFEGARIDVRKKCISLSYASKELLEQLKILLLRFGILSQLGSRNLNSYELTISGRSLKGFVHEIGFIDRQKQRLAHRLKGKANPLDIIPHISPVLKELRTILKLSQSSLGISRRAYQRYERGERNPTRAVLKKILKKFEQRFHQISELKHSVPTLSKGELVRVGAKLGLSKAIAKALNTSQAIKENLVKQCEEVLKRALPLLERIRLLTNSHVCWDEVIRIRVRAPKERWVYDLQVDETHNFIANNLIIHNSQLMQLASKLIPRGKYVSGTGVSGVGLTATVTRDEEFFGGWVLEAGALVLANRSLLSIDEFTQIPKDEMVKLQEAMSMGTVSIAKASIVATLPADTSVLAGANPKLGRFDPYIPIREQLALSDVILSRFDLKFALRDKPNPEMDARMVDHILQARHFKQEVAKPSIPMEVLRKYIAYARAKCHPKLTPEAGERLKQFYLQMRERSSEEAPVSITLRQYEALIRLAEASAKVRLSEWVEAQDAERAIELMKKSLRQFGFEPESGMIDIDRAEGQRITSAQRSKIRIMLDLFENLEAAFGKQVPTEELLKRAKEAGVENAEEILQKMMREGIVFSPRAGLISKV